MSLRVTSEWLSHLGAASSFCCESNERQKLISQIRNAESQVSAAQVLKKCFSGSIAHEFIQVS